MTVAVDRAASAAEVVTLGTERVGIAGHLELLHVNGGIRPVRLPEHYWSHFPPHADMLHVMVTRPSGVRILLRTTARRITLQFRSTAVQFGDAPMQPHNFVVVVDGAETVVPSPVDAIELFTNEGVRGDITRRADFSTVEFVDLPDRDKTVEIWLPQMLEMDLLSIEADAPLNPAPPTGNPLWVHHGSSISHGAELPLPTSAWPAAAARLSGLDVVNLGFAGQSMLDPFVADAIAATEADIITLELGINIVGARATDQRTFVPTLHGFVDRIRAGHPQTPIVVISPILWPGNEDAAGPAGHEMMPDGAARFFMRGTPEDVVGGALSISLSRDHLRHMTEVRAAAGEHIFYLDGRELFGEQDESRYRLPDGLHPDATLHQEIARRFARRVFGPDGLIDVSDDGFEGR